MQEKETNPQGAPAFQLGDRVSYCVANAIGNGLRISVREGKIVALEGQVAIVQARNGKRSMQPLDKLTPEGQPNALTRALLGK